MAGDWIKLKGGLEQNVRLFQLCDLTGLSLEHAVFALYKLACWFQTHGKYGKLRIKPSLIDAHLKIPSFAVALQEVGWLTNHDGVLLLRGFCTVSANRKALGKKLRRQLLDGTVCAFCGSNSNLEIDHKIPVSRGGSCEITNLHVLCDRCNRTKGRKTMEEFTVE